MQKVEDAQTAETLFTLFLLITAFSRSAFEHRNLQPTGTAGPTILWVDRLYIVGP